MKLQIIRKILKILNFKEKILLFFSLLMMFLNSIFEVLSIAILIPLLAFIFKSNQSNNETNNEFFNYIRETFSIFTFEQILLITFIIFFVKNAYILFYNYFVGLVAVNIRSRIIKDIYDKYLSQYLNFFSKRNSSVFLRNITNIQSFSDVIASILAIILETLLLIFFISILLLSGNKVTIFIILFLLLISSYFLIVINKKKILKYGKIRQTFANTINRVIIESISNIKSIKIFGIEKQISKQLVSVDRKIGIADFKSNFLLQTPRALIELIIIFSLLIILSVNFNNKDSLDTITYLAILIAISTRLMPSITRINAAIQRMKFYEPMINNISNEFNIKLIYESNNKKLLKKIKKIELKNLIFNYNKKIKILENVNLKLYKGKIYCFVGKNGSGKSTLINIICGLIKPLKGEVLYNNKNIKNIIPDIGYSPQQINLIDNSIKKNIIFGSFNSSVNQFKLKKALNIADLNSFVNSMPSKLNCFIGEKGAKISGGQAQKINIARSIYHDPEILVLDEFNNNLDKKSEKKILINLNRIKKNKIIILISHDENIKNYCDSIFIIEKGKLKQNK